VKEGERRDIIMGQKQQQPTPTNTNTQNIIGSNTNKGSIMDFGE
jgi:hypothetical protein